MRCLWEKWDVHPGLRSGHPVKAAKGGNCKVHFFTLNVFEAIVAG